MTDITPAAQMGLEAQQAAFVRALLEEDELGMVVRAHIHIEHQLIEFLRARLDPPEALDALDLDYSGRVKFALALGLSHDFKPALASLGTLRNNFAHKLGTKLTKQDANNFENALDPTTKDILRDAHVDTLKKFRQGQDITPIKLLDPKQRIISYLNLLWARIAAAAWSAKNDKQ
jgi:hypothetical protein